MALTEQQKSSIRRHLRYGNIGFSTNAAGGGSLGANAGWRFFGEWGDLEIRMDSLQPVDEACISGFPYGVIVLNGLDPNVGDQLSVQISGGGLGSPQTITVTAAGETRDAFAARFAAACAQNSAINAARFFITCPTKGTLTGFQNPISEIQFTCPTGFTLSIQSATGNIGAQITQNDATTDVQQVIGGTSYVGFLSICNYLWSLIGSASDRMAVDKAGTFVARKTEYQERREQWKQAVDDMADFLVARVNQQTLNGKRSNIGTL